MRRLVLASLLMLSLTGCAALPDAGPIRVGPDLNVAEDSQSFYYSPSSPIDGQSQLEVLNGFLAAGTGPQNDYAVAREYLSEAIRSSWNPSEEVLVQRASAKVELTSEDAAIVRVDLAAKVDADGRFETLPTGSNRELEFKFVKENEQWRISSAPNATILIRPVFDVVFRSYSIYFVDKQKRFLVPELRWFPTSAATGTKLANALLRGASSWLRPAVTSAIPSGTRLSIDAVTVENRVALVDLTARALVAGRADRTLMKAQLQATLSQLPNVEEVAISIERSRQEIQDPQGEVRRIDLRSLLIASDEGLELLGSGAADFFAAGKKFFELAEYSAIAASKQAGWLAGIAPSGVVRTSLDAPGETVELVDARTNVAAIASDPQGYLWSVSRARSNQIAVINQAGENSSLGVGWLAGQSIVAFSLAPEGTRVALLLQGESRNRVLLSSIVRDQAGVPIDLTAPLEIGSEVASPSAVSWVSDMQLAVVNQSGDTSNLYLVTPGGGLSVLSAVRGTVLVGSQGANSPLYALTQSGELYIFRSSSWSKVADKVRNLVSVY